MVRSSDPYLFPGLRCDIRSQEAELRTYLRWMHGRFRADGSKAPADLTLEIERSADRKEWLLHDGRYRYRHLEDGSVRWEDVQSGRRLTQVSCDPFTLAQCALTHGLAARTPGKLLHASAVSIDGEAVIFVATSHGGKTTLALSLAQAGCGFLSDEIAWIGEDSRTIEPFPRRVNLRHSSLELLGLDPAADEGRRPAGAMADGVSLDIDDIAPGSLAKSAPLGAIVFLNGFADSPRIEKIPKIDAARELSRHSLLPANNVVGALLDFVKITEKADCLRLAMGTPQATAELILSDGFRE